jgi:hypothetical protein
MGGANTGTNKIGEAQLAAGTVPKATQATPADIAAFDAQQAQNKRISQGLGYLAEGISDMELGSPYSKAKSSQDQAKKWKQFQMASDGDLNFMEMNPFAIRSTNPELISNAWANAGKTLSSSALSGIGKMYGM